MIHNKKFTVIQASSLKHIWESWWAVLSYVQNQTFENEDVFFRHSSTTKKILNINFWYFSWLFKKDRHEKRSVTIWISLIWNRIVSNEFDNIYKVDNVYDIQIQTSRRLKTYMNLNSVIQTQLKRVIDIFLKRISASWINLL